MTKKREKPSRDRTQFKYFTIGILHGSKLMVRLEQDAVNMGTQRITQVILARLNDYYELVDKIDSGLFYARGEGTPIASEASVDNAVAAADVWEEKD